MNELVCATAVLDMRVSLFFCVLWRRVRKRVKQRAHFVLRLVCLVGMRAGMRTEWFKKGEWDLFLFVIVVEITI